MTAQTSSVPQPDQIRQRVHRMWGAVAPSWGERADSVEARATDLTRLMIDVVAPAPGEQVLELACGAGGLGLALASHVSPGGRVVLSDVAPEMVEIAAARAAAVQRPDTELEARVLDMERLEVEDSSFDVVVCREGLMFALEPARATREICRVLRPGGRAAFAVWAARERNPWLGVLADAVAEQTGTPVPPPGVPGPFSLGADGALTDALEAGGLCDVQVRAVAMPTHNASFEDYWQERTDLAGPLKQRLAVMDEADLAAVKEATRTRLAAYDGPEGLRIPGLAYLASARRPD